MASSLNTSTALPYKALPHHLQQAIRTIDPFTVWAE